jgi:stage IV sporulation protein FB
MTQFATLRPEDSIDKAIDLLLRTSQNEFPVVDAEDRPIGVLGRIELIKSLKQLGPDARVSEAMASPMPIVNYRSCLDEAFRLLQEKSAPAVGVVGPDGRLSGLITAETIGEMLMVREAMSGKDRVGPWGRTAQT